MAITYTQNINSSYYPAHNDSYLKFTTNYSDDDRCVIIVDDTYTFTIFPNPTGEYVFNLKHLITAKLTSDKFQDKVDSSPAGWIFKDISLTASLNLSITVYGDGTSFEDTPTFSFSNEVKQYGDLENSDTNRILSHTPDNTNYHLTYWEGYPFDISLLEMTGDSYISFTNKRTGETTTNLTATNGTGPYRVFIDKGNTNWHETDFLQLPEMLSQLDYAISDIQKGSILLNKKANQCGTYLKWFNADGSYSYWLFNNWYKQDYEGKEFDRVGTNDFSPVYDNLSGGTFITGKQGSSSLKLKTLVDKEQMDVLKSLVTAPRVWMYTSREPFVVGDWLDVKVLTNNIPYNSKKYRNQVSVEIELPEVQTQKL